MCLGGTSSTSMKPRASASARTLMRIAAVTFLFLESFTSCSRRVSPNCLSSPIALTYQLIRSCRSFSSSTVRDIELLHELGERVELIHCAAGGFLDCPCL